MSDGIEKLQKYAFGMKPRRCDDILLLADQIQREHVSELQAIEKRYKTDLREARESRDIAIKESNEYNYQLRDIIEYIGACSRKKSVLSSQGRYYRIMSELYKRLMPPGVEWPKFNDGEKVNVGDYIMHDGSGERVQGIYFYKSSITLSLTGIDHEKLHTVEYVERIMRHETEVLGADGLPIKVGDTVYIESFGRPFTVVGFDGAYLKDADGGLMRADCATHTPQDTQERIDDDVCKISDACTYFSSDGSCAKCKFVSQYGDADSAYEECPKSVELDQMAILDLLRRQRELDARTMGGE